MGRQEFEVLLENVLAAVKELLIEPLVPAIHAVSVMACPDQESKRKLASDLRMHALNCPKDAFGRHYLEWIAEMLDSPDPTEPYDIHKRLRTSLRLISAKEDKEP